MTRLPQPNLQPVNLSVLVHRVAGLETRLSLAIQPSPDLRISVDPDQLEQALINLVRNAVDASLETGGGVSIGWRKIGSQLQLRIQDDGPGLPNSANLFVPFFTTKATGSGDRRTLIMSPIIYQSA